MLFHLGGDEFAIILASLKNETDAGLVARNLIRAFADPFVVGEHTIYTAVSVGIAVYPTDGERAPEIVRNADSAHRA